MAKNKTRGWYFFNDGYSIWMNGMSAAELKRLSAQHQGAAQVPVDSLTSC